jgi:hypothetical protein
MSLPQNNVSVFNLVSIVLVTFPLLAVNPAQAAEDCRAIKGDAERLACYDKLMSPSAPAPAPAPAPAAAAAVPAAVATPPATATEAPAVTTVSPPAAEPAPTSVAEDVPAPAAMAPEVLDDEVGLENVKGRTDKDQLLVKGHVSSCRKEKRGKYRFYFDNGQIWQQKDNRTVPWRECDFDVTIEKDFFGYKMLPVGEKRSIRISRIK